MERKGGEGINESSTEEERSIIIISSDQPRWMLTSDCDFDRAQEAWQTSSFLPFFPIRLFFGVSVR